MTPTPDGPPADPGRDALERGPRGAIASRPGRRGARAPERRVNWAVLLLANALPIGMVVWIFSMPAEKRQRMLDRIPAGVGARVGAAVAAIVLMLVLARLVLPAARGALLALLRAQGWARGQRGLVRVALYPVEFLAWLAWLLVQVLFAVDLVLILACGAAFLLYAVRVVKPEMFDWLPGPR